MKIKCDLYAQWTKAIRDEMTRAGVQHSNWTDHECAIRWQSWIRRAVQTKKRMFLRAKEFLCPPHLQLGLVNFESAVLNGKDIRIWQSKFIDKPLYEDGLFNDYSILHFHLGVGLDKDGFIVRTDELLFAIVDEVNVHACGIYNHGDWYELDILNVVDSNWPQLLNRVTINVLDVPNCPKTKEEIRSLRNAHVVSIVKLASGRIIAPPGGGMSTDGTSTLAVRSAMHWANLLETGSQLIISDIEMRVKDGSMPDKDYDVLLCATDQEISGISDSAKWILWKSSKQSETV